MGLNAPNAKYFCLYCDCDAESRWDMNQVWTNTGNSKSARKPSLFLAIDQEYYVPDELHLLLRISDVLIECLFNDLFKKKEFEKQIKPIIETIFKDLAILLEFFKTTNNKWNWTSLMGLDKKKMLEKFPVSQFISGERVKDIEQLWREFYRLYNVLRRSQLSDQEIYQYKIDVENWVQTFCRPNQGSINSIQKYGLYRKSDETPYMHVFAKHMPLFMQQLKANDLSLQTFSTSRIEKNHEQYMAGSMVGAQQMFNEWTMSQQDVVTISNRAEKIDDYC
ncbi:hypothetical protein C2G38_2169996 [Gigaspora rosea]|uniref:Uncharacterized protein n=1 Tax=Gigaspora rosea TaxID=44941 RepID=A0A397VSB8_9GLOM|nr:hypothetical protein C2G38_2169996 [Gigaspora rosea]